MTLDRLTILDGGLGRELERRGAPFRQPEWSALAMIEAPETVKEVHKAFIDSGAAVITTNSYALVPFHIGEERFRRHARALADAAGRAAHAAVAESGSRARVAGSLPPLFGSYRADLFQPQRVSEIVTPLIEGLSPWVELWLCETQSLIAEALSVRSFIDRLDPVRRPVWVAFTLEDDRPGREPLLRSGEPVARAVQALCAAEVDAILFNCCRPEVISNALRVTRRQLASQGIRRIEIGAYANAFPPQIKSATANQGLSEIREDLLPQAYLGWARQWRRDGATLIGGCCGIGPEHIALLARELEGPP